MLQCFNASMLQYFFIEIDKIDKACLVSTTWSNLQNIYEPLGYFHFWAMAITVSNMAGSQLSMPQAEFARLEASNCFFASR